MKAKQVSSLPLGDRKVRVQIVGFGVVGRGVAKALLRKTQDGKPSPFVVVSITDRSGSVFDDAGLDLKALVAAKDKHGTITHGAGRGARPDWDGEAAIKNVRADIVVEVTPTNIVDGEPGLTHIAEAMRLGKHVVTANKGPFALRFGEVARLAERAGVALKYGGSVCGAVPIIELVRDALVGNDVSSIRGVMNGSCNFILSKMESTGQTFAQALEGARKMGVTETDPSQDIDGWDAASKVVILANALMGRALTIRDVDVTGIRGVTAEQVRAAKKRGRKIRSIATLTRDVAKVAPVELEEGSPLAVDGTLNVATVQTDLAKDITIVGRGAGQMETASAILADLYAVLRERIQVRGASSDVRPKGLAGLEVREIAQKKVATVDARATLGDAIKVMRKKGISQIPVVRDGVPVGVLSERAVLDLLIRGGRKKLDELRVGDVMGDPLPEIGHRTPVVAVARILERKPAVLITKGIDIVGIVTRADLLPLVG